MRKESLYQVLNFSINQTLSRTIMTSGMTFLAVFSLFLFGGEVLNGFSFALTIGIIIGTYSSIGHSVSDRGMVVPRYGTEIEAEACVN